MHTAARKLHSQRGASMLFALLVFFLCLLAGVAALTAAAANVGRYTHLEGEQQQYYSVASALELLQAQLEAAAKPDPTGVTPLTVKATFTEKQEWWYEQAGTSPTGEPIYSLRPEGDPVYTLSFDYGSLTPNYFQCLLLNNCVPKEWVDKQTASTAPGRVELPPLPATTTPYKYTVEPDVTVGSTPDWAASLYPVNVAVQAAGGGSYTLEMTLTPENGSAYKLHAVWSGVAETDTQTTVKTEGEIFTAAPPDYDSKGTRTTTTVLTCSLRLSADNREVTFG